MWCSPALSENLKIAVEYFAEAGGAITIDHDSTE